MKPLRVILAMIEPPLPFGNAVARWYHVLLRGLVERGHRVTAFAACSNPGEMAAVREQFPASRYDLRCYPMPRRRGILARLQTLRRPYSYPFSSELRHDFCQELARGYDILHLESHWSAWLAPTRPQRSLLNIHYLFSIDLADTPPTSWGQWVERWLMFRGERLVLRGWRHLAALSPRLTRVVQGLVSGARVHTVPAGIDLSFYPYIPDRARTFRPIISMIGSMNWQPSFSAAVRLITRLWPVIRREVPDARLEVVGRQARSALRDHLTVPGVNVEENVPDIRPAFERSAVLLYAPPRGSGMKIKVLEAMAFGVPVVTNREGIEGLPAVDGIHAGVADDDAGLIEWTVRLLRDREAQNRQRAAARALVETHCSPDATLGILEGVYRAVLASEGPPAGTQEVESR